VHMDEKYFENADQFIPERFINKETGTLNGKCDVLVPFGLGKRACMGEALARMELYLLFTALLRHFTFRLPESAPKPSLESIAAMTLRPYPYEVIVERRQYDMK